MFKAIIEVVKGWIYLALFVTGGNFVRKSRIRYLGKGVKISPTAFFKFPEQIEIGEGSFINHLCSIWASPNGKITIGKKVLLGPGVTIVSSNHGIAAGVPMIDQDGCDQDVWIGDDVWIGAHVVVTPGVRIHNGCVVGAGAVVTRDLPENSICVGVPAKPVSYRKSRNTEEAV